MTAFLKGPQSKCAGSIPLLRSHYDNKGGSFPATGSVWSEQAPQGFMDGGLLHPALIAIVMQMSSRTMRHARDRRWLYYAHAHHRIEISNH